MAQLSLSGEEGQFLLTALKWQISPELKRVSKLSYATVVKKRCPTKTALAHPTMSKGIVGNCNARCLPDQRLLSHEFIIYFSKLLVNLFRLRHQAAVVINDVSTQSFGVKRQVGWYLARLRHGATSFSWNDLRLMRNFQQKPK